MTDDAARSRFIVISAARTAGVAMVVIGMLMSAEVIPGPAIAAYILVAVGVIDTFVVPQILARKWRTPPEADPGPSPAADIESGVGPRTGSE